jgi:hypothetical protein
VRELKAVTTAKWWLDASIVTRDRRCRRCEADYATVTAVSLTSAACVYVMLSVYLKGSHQWHRTLAASPPLCD